MSEHYVPASAPPPTPDEGWQALPPRARTLFLLGAVLSSLALVALMLVPVVLLAPSRALALALGLAVVMGVPTLLAWLAVKRHRHTRWRLDGDGFALRRGRLWRTDTRVPGSRVQHLDIRRGPIERRFGLSTLAIHTAGTRHNAVTLAGLDEHDAERLRDLLARGTGHGDDA